MSPAVLREHQRILASLWRRLRRSAAAGHGRAIGRTPGGGIAAARPALQGHHPQFGIGQCLRAADRPALRHARLDRAGQRRVRTRRRDRARDGACDRPPRRTARAGNPRRAIERSSVHRSRSTIRRPARWRSPSRSSGWRAFSQKQELEADAIGIGIAARAGFDPYGSVRFLASLERNSELKPRPNGVHQPGCARLPLIASGDAGAHQPGAGCCPPVQGAGGLTARSSSRRRGMLTSPISTAWSSARIRARASCAAGAFCIRGWALPSPRPRASFSTTPRRPCSASSTAATRRCGSTSCTCRPSRRLPAI